ncbi:MAG: flavodoxin family protein [Methanoregulaceae archaeon]|jgi:multimeric flavodoxin WrbA|nr:flavodoxin family protein [Methanoregulaceae archaeon]
MTPVKILVIFGSPRKGNTFRATEELRGILLQEFPVEFEYLWLKDANLLPCKGCLSCFSRGEEQCPNNDDAPLIEQKMREADGVVFATPVYGMNVSGQMKIFIDRFCYIFHRPRFFDKKALLLTTTGALGHKDVLKYLDTVARVWGFEIAGTVGLVTPIPLPRHRVEGNRKAIAKAAKKFAAALRCRVRKSPGLMDVVIFHGQRAAFSQLERLSPADYQYWNEKGWLERSAKYFVDVPVNPLYHAIGMVVEWISARQIRKDLLQDPGVIP